MKKIALTSLFLLFGSSLQAQVKYCGNEKTTVEINGCLRDVYEKVDQELNREYQKAMLSLDAPHVYPEGHFKNSNFKTEVNFRRAWKNDLLEVQRKWIQFKEADCALILYEWRGGTGVAGAELECLIDKTEGRIKELRRMSK